ncbi:MAG: nucleotide exchange factor GrpE [Vicinamibacterales bacterium]
MPDKEHEVTVKVVDRRWWANPDPDGDAPNTEPRGTSKPTYIADLEAQIVEKDRQIQEYLGKYRQASAEFEEARLRLRREISKDIERSRREIISELLEVLDNLDRALDSAKGSASYDSLLQGVEMVRRQFTGKLESFGVTKIEAQDQPFDPRLHEAISSVPAASPDQDGLIVGTVRTGYRIGDDVLRPAAVAVAKA